ncbi:Protein kinase [Boothiomyces sp. JEL0866]|nr:Protein kinase [Boothiomyces sp. JEL0866]
MNKQKLQEIEMNKKKRKDKLEKELVRKAQQKIYQNALNQMLQQPDLEDEGVDLSEFITKLKVEEKKDNVVVSEIGQLDYLSNFQKEALLLMRFNHPHIIKIFKVIESPEDVYIVMAFAYGGDLGAHISKNTYLTELEARRLFRQLISAVGFIHDSKVVHRDLKLENILLDEQGNILISDFGLGKAFARDDSMQTFCGTPSYAAPELIQGNVYHGAKTDIWAMGVILFAMVAGELPFVAESIKLLYRKIKKVQYSTPSHFSTELIELVGLIFVGDPLSRIHMENLRRAKWVNLDCSTLPDKILAPVTTNESLAKAISSVTKENNITIYSINAHQENQLLKTADTFETRQRQSSKNLSIMNLKRKKSISLQQSTEIFQSPTPTSPSMEDFSLTSSIFSFQVTSPSNSAINITPSKAEAGGSLHADVIPITRSHTINHFSSNRKQSLTISKENSGDVIHRRRSTSYMPFLRHSPEIVQQTQIVPKTLERNLAKERELSVIERMNKVSDIDDKTKLTLEEIQEWHSIHRPPKLIRTMKISCRKGLTSTLDPPVMFQDLHRALVGLQQSNDLVLVKTPDFYIFSVKIGNKIELEIELCKIWLLKLHALKITAKYGNPEEFLKALTSKLQWAN